MKTAAAIDWDEACRELLGQPTNRPVPPWIKLPALPTSVMQCVHKAQDPEAGPAEIAAILEKDSGLTCVLLRHVNSAAAGFQHRARHVQEAVVRLGMRGTMLFLLTDAVKELMKEAKMRLMNLKGFWCANLERALFAREVARLMKTDHELAFAGAMLSDCLMPLLTNRAAMTYLKFLQAPPSNPTPLTEFETQEFGWDHAVATANLLADWKFPSDIVCAVYLHHRGLDLFDHPLARGTAVAAVAVASLLPDQMRQSPGGMRALKKLEKRWREFNLLEIAQTVEREFQELAPETENPFPLLRRMRTRW